MYISRLHHPEVEASPRTSLPRDCNTLSGTSTLTWESVAQGRAIVPATALQEVQLPVPSNHEKATVIGAFLACRSTDWKPPDHILLTQRRIFQCIHLKLAYFEYGTSLQTAQLVALP